MLMAISDSDEKLYIRFLEKRDSDDLRVLLERYNESLTLFLYGFVKDMDDAEELMLDAFAVAASGTSRFSMKSSFKTWLFAIGRNLAMKHLRKNRIEAVPLNEEIMTEAYQHELGFDLFKEERYAALYRALEQLSPEWVTPAPQCSTQSACGRTRTPLSGVLPSKRTVDSQNKRVARFLRHSFFIYLCV